ncbi:hypothetical protein [Halorubrum aethiopicum]|uniref:hypothetical protein n=1 Tax=Halorubrum aethiopicum TaxID=1758255 RepID=UPI0012FF323E|nr:hypothetical protein [Halorubrum aethiopicum]
MANRRKFIAGLGALATGSAAAVGTSAFSQTSVERTASVATVGDRDAYLSLTPTSQYAKVPSDGTLELNFAGGGGGGLEQNGKGLNQNGITQFTDIFSIENQGTNQVAIFIDDNGEDSGSPSDSSDAFSISGYPDGNLNSKLYDAGIIAQVNRAGFFTADGADLTDVDKAPGERAVNTFGASQDLVLKPGESVSVGWYIDTTDAPNSSVATDVGVGDVDAKIALWAFSNAANQSLA